MQANLQAQFLQQQRLNAAAAAAAAAAAGGNTGGGVVPGVMPGQTPNPPHPWQDMVRMQTKQPFNLKPASSEAAQKTLRQYERRDDEYQAILNTQYKRHVELAQEKKKLIEQANLERRIRSQNPAHLFGPGYQSFGNGKTGFQPKIKYPAEKKRKQQVRFNL